MVRASSTMKPCTYVDLTAILQGKPFLPECCLVRESDWHWQQ
jgi:hypothetical protein